MYFYGGPMTGHNGTGLLLVFPCRILPHRQRTESPVLLFRGTNDGRMRNGRRYPVGFT
nr:MAG TPA: hypothetical protein [Caudoviricetes sp.]